MQVEPSARAGKNRNPPLRPPRSPEKPGRPPPADRPGTPGYSSPPRPPRPPASPPDDTVRPEPDRVRPPPAGHRHVRRLGAGRGECVGRAADGGGRVSEARFARHHHRPTLRRHGPGADGVTTRQLLRRALALYRRYSPRREQNHSGHGPDQTLFSPRHRHGVGDGRNRRVRQPQPGVHAARDGAAVRGPAGRRQRAGRLPGARKRHRAVAGRVARPGHHPRPADLRQLERRVGPAAGRGEPADGGGQRRPGPATGVQADARRPDRGTGERQRHHPQRQRPHRRPDADGADRRDRRPVGRDRRDSGQARVERLPARRGQH